MAAATTTSVPHPLLLDTSRGCPPPSPPPTHPFSPHSLPPSFFPTDRRCGDGAGDGGHSGWVGRRWSPSNRVLGAGRKAQGSICCRRYARPKRALVVYAWIPAARFLAVSFPSEISCFVPTDKPIMAQTHTYTRHTTHGTHGTHLLSRGCADGVLVFAHQLGGRNGVGGGWKAFLQPRHVWTHAPILLR